MTGLRDILRKKSRSQREHENESREPGATPAVTIIRSDTTTNEIISPPSFASEDHVGGNLLGSDGRAAATGSHSTTRSASRTSSAESRLSSLLHRHSHSRHKTTSVHVPDNLPMIGSGPATDDKEAQWEKRATLLARGSSGPSAEQETNHPGESLEGRKGARDPSPSRRSISDARGDVSRSIRTLLRC